MEEVAQEIEVSELPEESQEQEDDWVSVSGSSTVRGRGSKHNYLQQVTHYYH